MSEATSKELWCRCGHPQSFHQRGVGRCQCGCEAVRLHGRSPFLEVLELVDPGDPPRIVPTHRVRCPDCERTYDTRAYALQIVRRRRCRACSDARRAARKRPDAGASRPADLRPAEAFADRPHGTRVRYIAGCRCDACREANNSYERMRAKMRRAGQSNELVPATRARRHILALSARGLGRHTVADAASVPSSSVQAIRSGAKTQIRRETERRILEVTADAIADHGTVPAEPTWKLLKKLLGLGFTRSELARRLGSEAKTPALQIDGARVTAKKAQQVERLYRQLTE